MKFNIKSTVNLKLFLLIGVIATIVGAFIVLNWKSLSSFITVPSTAGLLLFVIIALPFALSSYIKYNRRKQLEETFEKLSGLPDVIMREADASAAPPQFRPFDRDITPYKTTLRNQTSQ